MKFTEFKRELEDKKESLAYLFEGEDAYFLERGLCLLKEKFLKEESLNFASFDGESCQVSDMISSLESYPFMADKRLVKVTEFYPKSDSLKQLLDYFKNPNPTSILIVLNSKPFEGFKKCEFFTFIDCNKQDGIIIAKWIKARFLESEISIDMETAKRFAEFCSCDMVRIQNETEKLISYIGRGGEILLNDIEDNVVSSTEYKIYEMTDYIAKKNFDLAVYTIKDMLSRGETPQRLILSIYNYFRRLLHASISDMSLNELATYFNVKEFAVKKIKEQSSLFKKKSLKNAVDMLSDADYKIKCGLIDPDEVFWLSVFKIMCS